MSQETKRTFTQIKQDYNNALYRSGQVQYQIFVLEKDLQLLNDLMRNLDAEAPAAKAAEDAENAAKAAQVAAQATAPSAEEKQS